MEMIKKTLSLLIVFSFLLQPIPGYSVEAIIDEDGETTPQNPPGTPEGVMCVSENIVPPAGRPCCVGLQPNAQGKCDEVPASSPSIVSCTSNADCSNGMGCFPQTVSGLQSGASFPNLPGAEEASSDFLDALSSSLEDGDGTKSAGASCAHSRECISYSCNAGICEDKKSCRYALNGEAVAGVNCASGLVKGADGKCGPSPEAANQTYIGAADPNNVQMNNQCQMTLPEDLKKSFIISMKAMRAMEVFLSNITIAARQEECFDVIPYLKELTREYVTQRKDLLYMFTKNFNDLEKDFETLKNAKAEGPDADKIVTIHGGEQILNKDLATRLTSGYDSLMIMYRRNLLFKQYEEAMKDLTNKFSINFMKMEGALPGYNNSGFPQGFAFGGKPETVPTWNCDASKYKKKKWWSWKTKYYTDVKDRWSVQYEIKGGSVSGVVRDDFVAPVLGLIHGMSKDEAIAKYSASKYYMLNPMIYWGRNPSQYGSVKQLKKKGGFLGFSGFKDLRKAYYISSYSQMLEDSRPVTLNHYKSLRNTELFTREALPNFLLEPDLVTTAAKDCLYNPKDPGKCEDFSKFMKEVQHEAFAHFLAFGYSKDDHYGSYFSAADSGRRKYFAKIMTDTKTLDKYYDIVINARVEQNVCLDKLMNGIEESGILASGPGGVTEGGVYYVPGRPTGNGLNPVSTRTNVNNDQLRALRRTGFNFNTGNSSLTTSTSSNMDNVAGRSSSAGSSSLSDSDRAFLASRRDAMRRANEKAAKAGVNVSKQRKAVDELSDELMKKSVAGRGASGSGSGTGLASGGASSGSGLGSAGQANVSATNPDGSTGPTGEGISGAQGINLNTAGAASGAGAGANGLAGIAGGMNSGSGYGDGSGQGNNSGAGAGAGKDGTGLSDADKDRLMSEYERNKKDYLGTEEDGLFSKVSKAYVRNLDKVLIKKKKIEP